MPRSLVPGDPPPAEISEQSVHTPAGQMEVDNRNIGPQNVKRKRHSDSNEEQTEETRRQVSRIDQLKWDGVRVVLQQRNDGGGCAKDRKEWRAG